MYPLVLWACFILCASIIANGDEDFRQERAQVLYYNPKYISKMQAFTGRNKRGESYRTNITTTTLCAFGNNITFELTYKTKSMPTAFKIKTKACDAFKHDWLREFMKENSNFGTTCPVPPGTYTLIMTEIPPKGFPLPIPQGRNVVHFLYYLTDRPEELIMDLRFTIVHS